MSEKKYYVFLSPLNNGNKPFFQLVKHGFIGELVGFAKCNTKNKNGRYENKYSRFTKSELGKIMGGVIYKGCILPDGHEFSSDCKPWINPIIELVPVEDGE
ncbi:hypothetical protein [Lactococcus lactis]|uniref:hypothetical protein n=1 Tax=Lactococcus lactis TaxID=1358 RepID=UPI00071D42C5|nr:hypothetical protein [Lactococcus lactis]